MAISLITVLDVIRPLCPEVSAYEHHGQFSIILPAENLQAAALELRDSPATQCNMLIDITVVDFLRKPYRYEAVYFLSSLPLNGRVRIKVPILERNPHVPSVTAVWESADWYEREAYDMYGIHFDGHPDMRRFYMPEDFADPETNEPLYPLRKDFPLMGVPGSLPLPPLPDDLPAGR